MPDAVIEVGAAQNFVTGKNSSGHNVGRAEDKTGHPGMHERSRAHGAGFERHHQNTVIEAIIAESFSRLAQRQNLGVRGGIMPRQRHVVGARQKMPVGMHDKSAHGDFSLIRGKGGFFQGKIHERFPRPARGRSRARPEAGDNPCPIYRITSLHRVLTTSSGVSQTLIERAADVMLKERRRLILVVRETPLSLIHLRNLTALAECGAVVLPAAPSFYARPADIESLCATVTERIVALVCPEAEHYEWGAES